MPALSPLNNFAPPTPISPMSPRHESTEEHFQEQIEEAGPSNHKVIPPPPNPRRHRSGILMSRVRANSSGTAFQSGSNVASSKTWGDLSVSALGMSTLDTDGDEESSVIDGLRNREGWKRVVSEPHRRGSNEGDETMWDNSARFYHHLHSRPASRSVSRSTSPARSPVSPPRDLASLAASPIYVRRSLTLPQNGPGPPQAISPISANLSPNHLFLQQHLPPTFPHSPSITGSSPEAPSLDPCGAPHPMVILTPTTQEWRELREIRRLEGENTSSEEGSSESDSDNDDRRSIGSDSLPASTTSSMRISGKLSRRPSLLMTLSADFLQREDSHTPDPGSPRLPPADGVTPDRPVFKPVIIAPSPVMLGADQVPVSPDTPSRVRPSGVDEYRDEVIDISEKDNFAYDADADLDEPIFNPDGTKKDSPARFNSIGRRSSLHVEGKSGQRTPNPKAKTKRELERERLFKDLDEEIESAPVDKDAIWVIGVQEIGSGGRLATADVTMDIRGNPFEKDFKTVVPPSPTKIGFSPTQPFRPSPLHGPPMYGLPSPEDTIGEPSPVVTPMVVQPSLPPRSPSPSLSASGKNLESIREFARKAVPPHPHHAHAHPHDRIQSASGTPSPPASPRMRRRRDTTRVSLVAGRVVQPFTIPPFTALPPEEPGVKKKASQPSLQSFSPFRSSSPASGMKSPGGGLPIPSFPRFDSSISIAPSTGAPSECGTPTSETAGGIGGRGIDDYVILREAGKGAYGLVMRAKVKGPKGEGVGDEVIIKYIIKARILADCWKKHKSLGPIPVEIHVMDQLRHLLYNPPPKSLPWDPARTRVDPLDSDSSAPNTPDSIRSMRSDASGGLFSPTQKYIASEIKHSPERGHPNICKLLDFFEDREFYYLVMPRFGTGLDLFDRVESQPSGLDSFEVRSLLGQLSDAVRFLHANGIVHRDIKDENVILDGQGRCQLIDFGSAAQWRPGKRWDTFSGTLHYASPEILRGEMYGGKEQDIWALGVVGYVLLVGETPFSELPDEVLEGLHGESSAASALDARCGGGGHSDEGKEVDGGGGLGDAMDLIKRCLEMEASDRPSAEAICQHRYLRGEGGWVGKRGWMGRNFKGN